MTNRINRTIKSLVIFLTAVIILNLCPVTLVKALEDFSDSHALSEEDNILKKSRVVVSMGDSYSSGEGLAPFYGDNHISDFDNPSPEFKEWLAHRSKNDSWPGQLVLPNFKGTLNDYKADLNTEIKDDGRLYWFFVASSGAKIKDIRGYNHEENGKKVFGGQKKKYSCTKNLITKTYTNYLDPQIDTLRTLQSRGIVPDYITISIGGNDMGFEEVIEKAITSTYFRPNDLRNNLNEAREKIKKDGPFRKDLKKIYHEINDASSIGERRPRIIVAGYPGLFDFTGKGAFFTKDEAQLIDSCVQEFNTAISEVVSECKKDMDIEFVDVLQAFYGHEAYSDDPYINKVTPLSRVSNEDLRAISVASARSMHPNKFGAQKYAECVQRYINWREDLFEYPALTPTPTPVETTLPDDVPTPPEITTPSAPAAQVIKVNDKYKKTRAFKTSYKSKNVTCAIPEIYIGDVDTDKTNAEIYKDFKVAEKAFKNTKKNAESVTYVRYEYYIGNGYISIICWIDTEDMSGNGPYFYSHFVYNIDTSDGHIMTKKQSLAKFGMSETDFTNAVKKKTSVKYDPKDPIPQSEYHERTNNIDAPKNAFPYMNKSGELCYATVVWPIGGPCAHDDEGVLVPKKKTTKPKVTVSNAVNKSYKDAESSSKHKYAIPKVAITGKNMDSINKKIKNEISKYDKTNHIEYSYYSNDKIVSILVRISSTYSSPSTTFKTYNISVSTGKIMSDADVVKLKGMTDDSFFETVKRIYNAGIYYSNAEKASDFYINKNLERVSYNYVHPYVNKSGNLCFVSSVYGIPPTDQDYVRFDTSTLKALDNWGKTKFV